MSLFYFPNVIGPNESNPNSETNHFAVVWTLQKEFELETLQM